MFVHPAQRVALLLGSTVCSVRT